uniref:Uncharacterized protein n=1 Tax=Setaria italica TaxID=4555 RepID=K3ZNQ9_SETIT
MDHANNRDARGAMRALSGDAITFKNKALLAVRPSPGQCLRPVPNGIILISLDPGRGLITSSPSPPARNRSGLNSSGLVHAFGSLPMSSAMNVKRTGEPSGGGAVPPTVAPLASKTSRRMNGTGGCSRRLSRMTARRYGRSRRLRDEASERPLDACHDRLGAGSQKPPEEPDDLVVPERAPPGVVGGVETVAAGRIAIVVGDAKVEERVNVRADAAAGAAVATPRPPPCLDDRDEDLGEPAAGADEVSPLPPAHQPRHPRARQKPSIDVVVEELAQRAPHGAQVALADGAVAEAQARRQTEHGVVQRVANDDDGRLAAGSSPPGGRAEVREEGLGGVPLKRREAGEALGVEDAGGEVAPEHAPERALGRAVDARGLGVPGVEVHREGHGRVVGGVGVVDDHAPGDVGIPDLNYCWHDPGIAGAPTASTVTGGRGEAKENDDDKGS